MHRRILFILLAYSVTAAALPPVKNISYQTGPYAQKLDLHFPKTPPPYKTVMLIHGGCFIAGSKEAEDTLDYVSRLLTLGYAVASVNYRLSIPNPDQPGESKNAYPAPLEDVQDALCWLSENGARYDLDTTEIVAMGYSAGATLANYLGTGHTAGSTRLPRCQARVSAVVDFFGRTNFLKSTEAYKNDNGLDCGEDFVGRRRDDSAPQVEFKNADLLTHIDARQTVPTLILHGAADGAVNVAHSVDLCAKLEGNCAMTILPGADHMFEYNDEMDKAFVEVSRFLAARTSRIETRLANITR